jgi:hypothetical protein
MRTLPHSDWVDRLQGIEAIVERQQRVPAEGNDDRFVFDRKLGGLCRLRAGRKIANEAAFLPFGDGLGVDA